VSWPTEPLGAICEIVSGITKDSKKQGDDYREVPYLRVANVQRLQLNLSEVKTIPAKESTIASYRLEPGDILLNEGGDRDKLGRGWIWQGQISECIHQNHVFRARIRDGKAIPKWIAYYANTNEARAYFLASGKQTTNLASISKKNLSALPVPLPPVDVQETLVAEIDTQLSRLDKAVTTLQGIQAKLKQARASILKAAVEGRLVETEAELAIRQGRTHELAAELLDTMDRQKNKKSATTSETAAPQWDAPTSWEWTNIGHVSLKVKYGTSAKCQERGDGIPVIRMGNIQDGKIHMDKIKYLPKTHHEFPEQLLRKGEVLFNRTNSIDLVGKTAVFRGDSPHACASYIIRVLPADGISPEFLAITLNSPFGRAWARHEASQQVGQANINSKKLMNFRFPLPPRLEQLRIKEEVDRRFSVLDQVEATVQTSLARCGKLQQAILKRAFGA
jgi:type I restriction enzyme S subunit